MTAPAETAAEQTMWLPSPIPRGVVTRTYGKHSDTRHLDDVCIPVAEILARFTPAWPTGEAAS